MRHVDCQIWRLSDELFCKRLRRLRKDCIRLADQADTPTLRERLLDLARIWKQAAIDEEALMNCHGVGVMTNRNPPYNGFRQGS